MTRRNCCEALIVVVAYCTLPICITGGEIYYDPVQRLEPVGALSLSKEQFSSRRYNMFKDFTIYTKLYLKKKTESYIYYVLELSACVIKFPLSSSFESSFYDLGPSIPLILVVFGFLLNQ